MFIPLLKFSFISSPSGRPLGCNNSQVRVQTRNLILPLGSEQQKGEDLSTLPNRWCSQGTKGALRAVLTARKCFVAAVAAPADFGVDR